MKTQNAQSISYRTICLAVSPSLKAHGVPGRPRLFEAKQQIERVNRERKAKAPGRQFSGKSIFASELAADPSLELDLVIAKPRMQYYIVDKNLTVRRFNIGVGRLLTVQEVKKLEEDAPPEQLSLFRDYETEEKEKKKEDAELDKERRMQEALISIRDRYGKNAVVKGLNMQEGATAMERNEMVGGHKK